MIHRPARCAALFAGGLLLACSDTPGPSGPADPPDPSFRAQHFIQQNAIYLGGDPSNPLVVAVGFEDGITPEDVCEGNGGVPEAFGKLVLTPSGGAHSHTFGRDVNLDVFAFGGGSGDPCAFTEAPLVATGTGKFTFNVQDNGRGTFVIHATVQGVVDLVAGGRARLFASARVTVAHGRFLFDDEVVRLKPL